MEAINDSLKNVTQSIELIKSFLESRLSYDSISLKQALELLEKTAEELSKAV